MVWQWEWEERTNVNKSELTGKRVGYWKSKGITCKTVASGGIVHLEGSGHVVCRKASIEIHSEAL